MAILISVKKNVVKIKATSRQGIDAMIAQDYIQNVRNAQKIPSCVRNVRMDTLWLVMRKGRLGVGKFALQKKRPGCIKRHVSDAICSRGRPFAQLVHISKTLKPKVASSSNAIPVLTLRMEVTSSIKFLTSRPSAEGFVRNKKSFYSRICVCAVIAQIKTA